MKWVLWSMKKLKWILLDLTRPLAANQWTHHILLRVMVLLLLKEKVKGLLQDLHEGWCPKDNSPETTTDQFLNSLSYKDFPALCCAWDKLTVKAKDLKLDVFFQSHITSMVATLNLYLDPELSYTWCESCTKSPKMDQEMPLLRDASSPLLWNLSFFYPGGWGLQKRYSVTSHRNCKERIHTCTRHHWLCGNTRSPEMAGN